MNNLEIHAADLLEAARKMEDAANRIDNALQNLDATMSDFNTVWSGEVANKYLARYAELKQEFPEFKAAVHSYGTFLNDVVNTYQREFVDQVTQSVQ